MSHDDLALSIFGLASDRGVGVGDDSLDAMAKALRSVVEIEDKSFTSFEGGDRPNTVGLVQLKFHERKFYSVKMGNLNRDLLGASTMAGTVLAGSTSLAVWISTMVVSGALLAWPGLGVIAAAGLIAMGRLKPLLDSLTFDDATAFALAWEHSTCEQGFQLAYVKDVIAHLEEAETVYGNHGFTEAKLRNAFGTLKAKRLVSEVNPECFQLIESLKIRDGKQLKLFRA